MSKADKTNTTTDDEAVRKELGEWIGDFNAETTAARERANRFRAKPVQSGFIRDDRIDRPQASPIEKPDQPQMREAVEQRISDPDPMQEAANLKNTINQTIAGLYEMPPKPRNVTRDGTQEIDAALAEAFPAGDYPKAYAAKRAKLKPIYDREGWGEVPGRHVIDRAISRLKRR